MYKKYNALEWKQDLMKYIYVLYTEYSEKKGQRDISQSLCS